MSSSSESPSLTHSDRLLLYCRLCGGRGVPRCPRSLLRPVAPLAAVLQRLHGEHEAGGLRDESGDVYPRHVCAACHDKLFRRGEDGKNIVDKIDECHRSGGDPDLLVRLSRQVPLAEFYAHGAQGLGCQVCDDDDFYGGAAATALDVARVRKWRKLGDDLTAVHAPSARPAEYDYPALPWFDEGIAESRSPELTARVTAETFRRLAQDREHLDAIRAMRALGVAFRDVSGGGGGESGADGRVEAAAKTVVAQIEAVKKEDRAFCTLASILKSGNPDAFSAVGITVDHQNESLKERLRSIAVVRTTTIQQRPVSNNGNDAGNDADVIPLDDEQRPPMQSPQKEIKVTKKKLIGPASVTRRATPTKAAATPARRHPAITARPPSAAPNPVRQRIPPEELEAVKKRFHAELPSDRFARADIVRFLMETADGQKMSLLSRVGIAFDARSGGYIQGVGAFDRDRARAFKEKLNHLIDIQWAVVVAEASFRLLDPKETRSLELAGILIDADNPKTPLFYRLQRAAKRELVDAALGQQPQSEPGNLAVRMCRRFALNTSLAHVKAVEAAFGVAARDALRFLERGIKGAAEGNNNESPSAAKKPTKPQPQPSTPLTSRKPPTKQTPSPSPLVPKAATATPRPAMAPPGPAKQILSPASKRRIIEGDGDGDDDCDEWTPAKKGRLSVERRRSNGIREAAKKVTPKESEDDDVVDLAD